MKLVKFAPIHCAAISVFLFAAFSAQAEYVWTGNGVDGEGNPTNDWNVSGNWELARTVTDKSTAMLGFSDSSERPNLILTDGIRSRRSSGRRRPSALAWLRLPVFRSSCGRTALAARVP